MVKSALKACSRAVANAAGQVMLENTVALCQYLQGIGAADLQATGEGAVLRKLRREAKARNRKPSIFDVGANQGRYLALAGRQMAPYPFEIHCFEPSRAAFDRLSAAASPVRGVVLNNLALGRAPGGADLYADAPGSELASLTKRRLAHFGIELNHAERVRVDSLDNYCEQRGIAYVDLLKIDAEGHELDVLYGAERMLRRDAVGLVSFEFGGAQIDTRTFLQDFFYFFAQHGMSLARISPCGYFHDIGGYREIFEQFRTTYFIAYRASGRRVR